MEVENISVIQLWFCNHLIFDWHLLALRYLRFVLFQFLYFDAQYNMCFLIPNLFPYLVYMEIPLSTTITSFDKHKQTNKQTNTHTHTNTPYIYTIHTQQHRKSHTNKNMHTNRNTQRKTHTHTICTQHIPN